MGLRKEVEAGATLAPTGVLRLDQVRVLFCAAIGGRRAVKRP